MKSSIRSSIRWLVIALLVLCSPFILSYIATIGEHSESLITFVAYLDNGKINITPFRWCLLLVIYFCWDEIIYFFFGKEIDRAKEFVLKYMKNYFLVGAVFVEIMTFLFTGELW